MSEFMGRIMMISTHGYVAATPEFGKPDTGGQVVYVLELSKCLARMGFQVDILTRRFEDQPARETVSDGVDLLRFACGGNEFIRKETLCEQIPEWVENVRAFVAENDIQYTFINSHYWDAGLAGQALSEQLHVPHLHTPHSIGAWKRDNMDGKPEKLEKTYNFRRRIHDERDVYQRCDVVIATTPQQLEILSGADYELGEDKIRVIPPGYDDTRFFPVAVATRDIIKKQYGLDGPIVLALGRMARNKGYDLLIQAMATVCQRVPEARLVLAVGATDPNDKESRQINELKQVAEEAGITDRVLYHDYIPDEQLADYYRAADVFALSSRYEPFGMTAVEAMACGTPTVITTEGGLWQQVTWGLEALYANPFDPEAFGHAIAAILKYEKISEQLGKNGSLKARARFTWNGIAQQLLGLLEDVNLPPTGEPSDVGETASDKASGEEQCAAPALS